MARHAEHALDIAATPQQCFDTLVDFEAYPDWQDAVKACEVLARDGSGRGRDVAFEIDVRVRRVRYRLRYSYEEPHRIGWDYLGGDVKDVGGGYRLEDAGDGRTRATYSLEIDPGMWVPGPVARMLSEQVMRRHVEDLRRRVEGAG
jgi:uncharacterized membrane protein